MFNLPHFIMCSHFIVPATNPVPHTVTDSCLETAQLGCGLSSLFGILFVCHSFVTDISSEIKIISNLSLTDMASRSPANCIIVHWTQEIPISLWNPNAHCHARPWAVDGGDDSRNRGQLQIH